MEWKLSERRKEGNVLFNDTLNLSEGICQESFYVLKNFYLEMFCMFVVTGVLS